MQKMLSFQLAFFAVFLLREKQKKPNLVSPFFFDDDDVVFMWCIIHVNALIMHLTMKFPPLQPVAELRRNQRDEIGCQHIKALIAATSVHLHMLYDML